MANLRLEGICKTYGDVTVITGLDLSVRHGEFVSFVGPSGCGKSTLLRMICGIERITEGDIIIDDVIVNDKPPRERGVSMVFQSYALYPHMTVRQNMGYALKLAKLSRADIDAKVEEAAQVLQITPLLERYPRQLSGGQRQRVAIGRAITREPKLFLFDEPLSNLDASLRVEMRVEIARLAAALKTTMIYVTHDQTEAMTLSDRIVVLDGGIIQQCDTPLALYHNPVNRFVAGFIGSPRINFINGHVTEDGRFSPDGADCAFGLARDTTLDGGTAAEMAVRPEHCVPVAADEDAISGRVAIVEHLGVDTYAHIDSPASDQPVIMRLPADSRVRQGEIVHLRPDMAKAHLFDTNGQRVTPDHVIEAIGTGPEHEPA